MRKTFLYFYLILSPAFTSAQSEVEYAYDMAGNHIERETVTSAPQAMAKKQSFRSQDFYSERLREHSAKICPDPTQGNLKVGTSDLETSGKRHLGVYPIQDTQIFAFDVSPGSADVDISNQPSEIYLL